jgi:signal transduction histidine kinase
MKLNIFTKFLLSLFLLTLVPVGLSSVTLFRSLQNTSSQLAERISAATDRQASENLESRARQIADDVAWFLGECENDLRLVAALPHTADILGAFYASRQGEIWQRGTPPAHKEGVRKTIPRYALLELIDSSGRQRLVIRDGRLLPEGELRNVAEPAGTLYGSETYFRDTARLKRGAVYVSHLTGFHVAKQEQLGSAADSENAHGGREYRGIVRFATPLFDARGRFDGIIVISLDHRHLMEFSQHEQPGRVGQTVFPSYKSGNYAFIFDDEGWIITHPNFWDIRGLYPDGTLVPPYRAGSTPAEIAAGRTPFNLDHAGFIHPNYPVAAQAVREGKSGYVDTTNVGGATKVMAYAPIRYRTGDYSRHGVFGGVTIGFQTDLFHGPARTAAGIIHDQMHDHLRKSALFLTLTTLLALLAAWRISRGITRPLALLTQQARALATGSGSSRVEVVSRDELGELADDFNTMAAELETRNSRLMETLAALDRSRREVTDERNLMEGVVNSISSAILPFSPGGELISVNTYGRTILGEGVANGSHYRELFAAWPGLVERIEATVAGERPFGRAPCVLEKEGGERFYDVGIFPIGAAMEQGITVTIRDETEKERMREEMTRLDRFASLGKLSAGIAHEIRNPLTGITLLLDDLHDRPDLDPESTEMMGKALGEIERMERLVNSLLSYAAPPRARFRQGDLNWIVEETLPFFRKVCRGEGVELKSSPGEVPEFVFDGEKIRQVLLNLLRNALSATPRGGSITVATGVVGERAFLMVSDTGAGIEAGDRERIFDPFFTKSSGGTGLGLSISQRIVEEHHGSIELSSSGTGGAVFTVMLPLGGQTREIHGKDTHH